MSEAQLFATTTFTEIYERVLVGPLFRPFAEQLLSKLQPAPGDSLLDVACGTGIVARVARERLGPQARIVGVDVAPAMLAVAQTVEPSIDWRHGDATALPVDNTERFTIVTCEQGLQFMPDKPAAVREMRRVLEAGGRVGIATWLSVGDLPGIRDLNAVVERHVGPVDDRRHGLGDADTLRGLLVDAGFTGVEVGTLAHDVQFADGALFVRLNAMALLGMSDKGKTMAEGDRMALAEQVVADSRDLISAATTNGTFVVPMKTLVATGRA